MKTPQPLDTSELTGYKEVEQVRAMKSFKGFRLDTANHLRWCNGDRVPVAPKGFDVLAYLIAHAGRVVTQDEILEAVARQNPKCASKAILQRVSQHEMG